MWRRWKLLMGFTENGGSCGNGGLVKTGEIEENFLKRNPFDNLVPKGHSSPSSNKGRLDCAEASATFQKWLDAELKRTQPAVQ